MLIPYRVTLVDIDHSELLSGCFNHIRRNSFGLGFVRVPHYAISQSCVKAVSPDLRQRRGIGLQPFVVTQCDVLQSGLGRI